MEFGEVTEIEIRSTISESADHESWFSNFAKGIPSQEGSRNGLNACCGPEFHCAFETTPAFIQVACTLVASRSGPEHRPAGQICRQKAACLQPFSLECTESEGPLVFASVAQNYLHLFVWIFLSFFILAKNLLKLLDACAIAQFNHWIRPTLLINIIWFMLFFCEEIVCHGDDITKDTKYEVKANTILLLLIGKIVKLYTWDIVTISSSSSIKM